jgi:hypothetical protein
MISPGRHAIHVCRGEYLNVSWLAVLHAWLWFTCGTNTSIVWMLSWHVPRFYAILGWLELCFLRVRRLLRFSLGFVHGSLAQYYRGRLPGSSKLAYLVD